MRTVQKEIDFVRRTIQGVSFMSVMKTTPRETSNLLVINDSNDIIILITIDFRKSVKECSRWYSVKCVNVLQNLVPVITRSSLENFIVIAEFSPILHIIRLPEPARRTFVEWK